MEKHFPDSTAKVVIDEPWLGGHLRPCSLFPFDRDPKLGDFFPKRVAVHSHQEDSLNLISFSFLEDEGDQRAFDGVDEHVMKISRRAALHPFDKFAQLEFDIVFKAKVLTRTIEGPPVPVAHGLHEPASLA